MSQQNGRARIQTGEDNTLTEFQGDAVVTLGGGVEWKVKYHGDPAAPSPKVIFILHKIDTSAERALTLSNESSGDWTDIVVQELESPPSDCQLWTLEEAIAQLRFPPIVHARIQSVADPQRSAAIGGDRPLPRLYMNVAALPNEPGSETQRWRLDYLELE